jgi:hypothetical protein
VLTTQLARWIPAPRAKRPRPSNRRHRGLKQSSGQMVDRQPSAKENRSCLARPGVNARFTARQNNTPRAR